MSEPISESLFEAVLCRLSAITLVNGYFTEAGSSIHRARRSFTAGELPALSVFDGGESPINGSGTGKHQSMTMEQVFTVEILAEAEQADTGRIVGRMKSDVKRAVLSTDLLGAIYKTTGAKLGYIEYRGAVPTPREDGGVAECVTLTFAAIYPEAYGDPTRVI